MFIARWIINSLAVMLAAYLVPGVTVRDFWSALIAALVIGLVNAIIRPIAIILTLPINILTLGLFTLVINALMFWLASSIVPGFKVDGFWPAFGGALVFWAVSWVSNSMLKEAKER
jgi:putative membrane protein